MENLYTARIIRHSPFAHPTDNASCLLPPPPPPPQKKLNNLGFSFLLGITIASREIEDNAYADFYLRRWWWGGGVGKQDVFWEMYK